MVRQTFTYEGKRHDIRAKNWIEFAEKVAIIAGIICGKDSSAGIDKIVVDDWFSTFLKVYKGHRSKRTQESYVQRYRKHISPYIGSMYLHEVQNADCQIILNGLTGYSADTIKKIYHDLDQLFEKGIINHHVVENPLYGVERPDGGSKERRALTDEELALVLKVAQTSEHGLYFLMMLGCGLRPHETAFIQGKDIQNGQLHIRGIKTKKADRFVPIPSFIQERLPEIDDEEYLFKSDKGIAPLEMCHRRYIWNAFKAELNAANGKPISKDVVPYCFRHSYGTLMQESGVPLNVARELMGHTNVRTTQRYTHNTATILATSSTRIDSLFNEKTEQAFATL